MKLKVLGTGSSGNCYILESEGNKLILDAGMPMKKVIQMCGGLIGVEGCLVTHEHKDHSVAVFDMVHYGIHVYGSHGTMDILGLNRVWVPFCHEVEMNKPVDTGSFVFVPFHTEHDAQEPCGFLIKDKATDTTIIYATDTYYLRNTFPNINYWIIECNYTDSLLKAQAEQGLIERQLMNRLRKSHMSLARLKQTLKANDLSKTAKIILVHLSDARSDEEQMVREITELTGIDTVAVDANMEVDLNLIPF